MEQIACVGLATLLLFAAVRVITAGSPLRAALALVVAQVALSGLYVLLAAPLVASLQILLYAGAVMVLFVFVIMLLNLRSEPLRQRFAFSPLRALAATVVGASVIRLLSMHATTALPLGRVDGSLHNVGSLLLGRYAFAFEAVSLTLLIAVVGSVVLSLRRLT